MANVIGADHDHRERRVDSLQFTVGDAPEHMLRPVSADSEIRRLVAGEL
jgi:hypothetical protein